MTFSSISFRAVVDEPRLPSEVASEAFPVSPSTLAILEQFFGERPFLVSIAVFDVRGAAIGPQAANVPASLATVFFPQTKLVIECDDDHTFEASNCRLQGGHDQRHYSRDRSIATCYASGKFGRLFPCKPLHKKFKILFLCTWNSSRSIFAEYFMKEIGSDRFEGFSAGVRPRGQVSPITLRVLQAKFRIDASGARSKSWEEFKDAHLDFVVSVSEQAEQTSHAFPGQPILAHWPYDDPTRVQGTPEQVEAAYFRVASRIRYRLQLFSNLSFDQLDRLRIEVQMKKLAESS